MANVFSADVIEQARAKGFLALPEKPLEPREALSKHYLDLQTKGLESLPRREVHIKQKPAPVKREVIVQRVLQAIKNGQEEEEEVYEEEEVVKKEDSPEVAKEVETKVEEVSVLEKLDPKLRKIIIDVLQLSPRGGLTNSKIQDDLVEYMYQQCQLIGVDVYAPFTALKEAFMEDNHARWQVELGIPGMRRKMEIKEKDDIMSRINISKEAMEIQKSMQEGMARTAAVAEDFRKETSHGTYLALCRAIEECPPGGPQNLVHQSDEAVASFKESVVHLTKVQNLINSGQRLKFEADLVEASAAEFPTEITEDKIEEARAAANKVKQLRQQNTMQLAKDFKEAGKIFSKIEAEAESLEAEANNMARKARDKKIEAGQVAAETRELKEKLRKGHKANESEVEAQHAMFLSLEEEKAKLSAKRAMLMRALSGHTAQIEALTKSLGEALTTEIGREQESDAAAKAQKALDKNIAAENRYEAAKERLEAAETTLDSVRSAVRGSAVKDELQQKQVDLDKLRAEAQQVETRVARDRSRLSQVQEWLKSMGQGEIAQAANKIIDDMTEKKAAAKLPEAAQNTPVKLAVVFWNLVERNARRRQQRMMARPWRHNLEPTETAECPESLLHLEKRRLYWNLAADTAAARMWTEVGAAAAGSAWRRCLIRSSSAPPCIRTEAGTEVGGPLSAAQEVDKDTTADEANDREGAPPRSSMTMTTGGKFGRRKTMSLKEAAGAVSARRSSGMHLTMTVGKRMKILKTLDVSRKAAALRATGAPTSSLRPGTGPGIGNLSILAARKLREEEEIPWDLLFSQYRSLWEDVHALFKPVRADKTTGGIPDDAALTLSHFILDPHLICNRLRQIIIDAINALAALRRLETCVSDIANLMSKVRPSLDVKPKLTRGKTSTKLEEAPPTEQEREDQEIARVGQTVKAKLDECQEIVKEGYSKHQERILGLSSILATFLSMQSRCLEMLASLKGVADETELLVFTSRVVSEASNPLLGREVHGIEKEMKALRSQQRSLQLDILALTLSHKTLFKEFRSIAARDKGPIAALEAKLLCSNQLLSMSEQLERAAMVFVKSLHGLLESRYRTEQQVFLADVGGSVAKQSGATLDWNRRFAMLVPGDWLQEMQELEERHSRRESSKEQTSTESEPSKTLPPSPGSPSTKRTLSRPLTQRIGSRDLDAASKLNNESEQSPRSRSSSDDAKEGRMSIRMLGKMKLAFKSQISQKTISRSLSSSELEKVSEDQALQSDTQQHKGSKQWSDTRALTALMAGKRSNTTPGEMPEVSQAGVESGKNQRGRSDTEPISFTGEHEPSELEEPRRTKTHFRRRSDGDQIATRFGPPSDNWQRGVTPGDDNSQPGSQSQSQSVVHSSIAQQSVELDGLSEDSTESSDSDTHSIAKYLRGDDDEVKKHVEEEEAQRPSRKHGRHRSSSRRKRRKGSRRPEAVAAATGVLPSRPRRIRVKDKANFIIADSQDPFGGSHKRSNHALERLLMPWQEAQDEQELHIGNQVSGLPGQSEVLRAGSPKRQVPVYSPTSAKYTQEALVYQDLFRENFLRYSQVPSILGEAEKSSDDEISKRKATLEAMLPRPLSPKPPPKTVIQAAGDYIGLSVVQPPISELEFEEEDVSAGVSDPTMSSTGHVPTTNLSSIMAGLHQQSPISTQDLAGPSTGPPSGNWQPVQLTPEQEERAEEGWKPPARSTKAQETEEEKDEVKLPEESFLDAPLEELLLKPVAPEWIQNLSNGSTPLPELERCRQLQSAPLSEFAADSSQRDSKTPLPPYLRPTSCSPEPSKPSQPPRPASTGCEWADIKRPTGPIWFRSAAESPTGLPVIRARRSPAQDGNEEAFRRRRSPSPASPVPCHGREQVSTSRSPSPRSRPGSRNSFSNPIANVSLARGRQRQEILQQIDGDPLDNVIAQTSIDAGLEQIQHSDLRPLRAASPLRAMTPRAVTPRGTPRAVTPRPQVPRQSRKAEAALNVAAAVACQQRLLGTSLQKSQLAPAKQKAGVQIIKEKQSKYLPQGDVKLIAAPKTPNIAHAQKAPTSSASGAKKGGSVLREGKGLPIQTKTANTLLQAPTTQATMKPTPPGSSTMNH